MEERLKKRFEAMLASIEVDITDDTRNNKKYVTKLKVCILVREEQLQTSLLVVKKDIVIADRKIEK